MITLCISTGLDAPIAVVRQLFDSFDADGSGTIEYQEIARVLKPKATDQPNTAGGGASSVPARGNGRFALRQGIGRRRSFLGALPAEAVRIPPG